MPTPPKPLFSCVILVILLVIVLLTRRTSDDFELLLATFSSTPTMSDHHLLLSSARLLMAWLQSWSHNRRGRGDGLSEYHLLCHSPDTHALSWWAHFALLLLHRLILPGLIALQRHKQRLARHCAWTLEKNTKAHMSLILELNPFLKWLFLIVANCFSFLLCLLIGSAPDVLQLG